jgi:FtsH-binding integral membrane protein
LINSKAAQPVTVSEARVNAFLARTYLIMAFGLLITGIVATWTGNNLNLLLRLNTNPWIAFGLFIVQIFIVAMLSAAVLRLAPLLAALLFVLYAGLTGLTISSIFLVYTQETISYVFWLTAGTFFLTSLFGIVFKRDLSTSGSVLFMLLLGWTFAWLVSWLFPFSNFNWLLTYLGIAIFVGLTAYDAQRLKQIGQRMDSHPARGGLVILGALTLYLDFINLFLLLLRASRRSS